MPWGQHRHSQESPVPAAPGIPRYSHPEDEKIPRTISAGRPRLSAAQQGHAFIAARNNAAGLAIRSGLYLATLLIIAMAACGKSIPTIDPPVSSGLPASVPTSAPAPPSEVNFAPEEGPLQPPRPHRSRGRGTPANRKRASRSDGSANRDAIPRHERSRTGRG